MSLDAGEFTARWLSKCDLELMNVTEAVGHLARDLIDDFGQHEAFLACRRLQTDFDAPQLVRSSHVGELYWPELVQRVGERIYQYSAENITASRDIRMLWEAMPHGEPDDPQADEWRVLVAGLAKRFQLAWATAAWENAGLDIEAARAAAALEMNR